MYCERIGEDSLSGWVRKIHLTALTTNEILSAE